MNAKPMKTNINSLNVFLFASYHGTRWIKPFKDSAEETVLAATDIFTYVPDRHKSLFSRPQQIGKSAVRFKSLNKQSVPSLYWQFLSIWWMTVDTEYPEISGEFCCHLSLLKPSNAQCHSESSIHVAWTRIYFVDFQKLTVRRSSTVCGSKVFPAGMRSTGQNPKN